ncbi:MAG: hypothetical protein HZB61_05175 [Nitrospirae bacterium]|nr:hypothetical protein [Nitrospirota bacterium]
MTPGGLWDSNKYEIKAIVKYNGEIINTVPLGFAGTPSLFKGELNVTRSGTYEVTVYAYDPQTGNTGVNKKTVKVL